jgi:acetolactate synthase-1/2/3 large subunit
MSSNGQAPKTGADVVVETLEARDTKYVFGVPGAKIDKVFDRLVDSKIQTHQDGSVERLPSRTSRN